MSTPNIFLTSLSQLDEFNKEVLLKTEREERIGKGLGKPEFVDRSSPCADAVITNAVATAVTDSPPLPDGNSAAALPNSQFV